uniref:F-box domain-containing protein n=1 Tax=Timema shepardi TaxID=629360 RepID=A0A7R9G530_TIMSH|nr:unnamed protein product [Timema shepardi]
MKHCGSWETANFTVNNSTKVNSPECRRTKRTKMNDAEESKMNNGLDRWSGNSDVEPDLLEDMGLSILDDKSENRPDNFPPLKAPESNNNQVPYFEKIGCVHEGSGHKIGFFPHPLATMIPLLALPHAKVVMSMSNVVWGPLLGKLTGPYVVVPAGIPLVPHLRWPQTYTREDTSLEFVLTIRVPKSSFSVNNPDLNTPAAAVELSTLASGTLEVSGLQPCNALKKTCVTGVNSKEAVVDYFDSQMTQENIPTPESFFIFRRKKPTADGKFITGDCEIIPEPSLSTMKWINSSAFPVSDVLAIHLSQFFQYPDNCTTTPTLLVPSSFPATPGSASTLYAFSKLSDEMVLTIFRHMPKKSLVRCAFVCKRWRRIAYDESLWSRLDLSLRTLRPGNLGYTLVRGVSILRLAQAEDNSFTITEPQICTVISPTSGSEIQPELPRARTSFQRQQLMGCTR